MVQACLCGVGVKAQRSPRRRIPKGDDRQHTLVYCAATHTSMVSFCLDLRSAESTIMTLSLPNTRTQCKTWRKKKNTIKKIIIMQPESAFAFRYMHRCRRLVLNGSNKIPWYDGPRLYDIREKASGKYQVGVRKQAEDTNKCIMSYHIHTWHLFLYLFGRPKHLFLYLFGGA